MSQIKSLVNDGLRPALAQLTQIQPQLKGWHQDTINQMLNSAKALAADTNSAILNQDDKGTVPTMLNPEYKQLISSINEHAETLVKTADAAGDYAAAHAQSRRCRSKVT